MGTKDLHKSPPLTESEIKGAYRNEYYTSDDVRYYGYAADQEDLREKAKYVLYEYSISEYDFSEQAGIRIEDIFDWFNGGTLSTNKLKQIEDILNEYDDCFDE